MTVTMSFRSVRPARWPGLAARRVPGLLAPLLGSLLGGCALARVDPPPGPLADGGPSLASSSLARQSGAAAPAAKEHQTLWPTFGVNVGGALLGSFDTHVRLDSATLGRGTEISLENDLGFGESSNVLRLDAYWRINRHHRFDLSYFDISREATRTIDRDIQFGDDVFTINTTVTAFFDTEIFKGAYRFTPFAEDTWEVGLSLGLHWMSFGTGIAVTGLGALSEEFRADAPLPVVGLHSEWEFLPRLRLRASAEVFYVDIGTVGDMDNITGLISDNVVAVEWDALRYLGVGVGYNYFLLDAEVERNALTLSSEYEYDGLLVYGRAYF